jgi:hypothetical protein
MIHFSDFPRSMRCRGGLFEREGRIGGNFRDICWIVRMRGNFKKYAVVMYDFKSVDIISILIVPFCNGG